MIARTARTSTHRAREASYSTVFLSPHTPPFDNNNARSQDSCGRARRPGRRLCAPRRSGPADQSSLSRPRQHRRETCSRLPFAVTCAIHEQRHEPHGMIQAATSELSRSQSRSSCRCCEWFSSSGWAPRHGRSRRQGAPCQKRVQSWR